MQYRFLCFVVIVYSFTALQAQEYHWRVGMDYFFDNMEYKNSSFADARTLQGIWLKPLGAITWDSTHTIYAGVDMLKMPGMKHAVDKVEMIVYYQYETDKVLFRAGAFPRRDALSNYSDFFFRDSVNHFMPLMQGLFWQVGKGGNFFNAWMDWTGYSTAETRESFFLGFSGKATKGLFFADFQSTLFHFAGTYPNNGLYGVSEQIQGIASVGMALASGNHFRGMASAGIFAGLERDRKADLSYRPVGFVARANADYMGIGIENTFYAGDPRMRLYSEQGSDLYWGTPFLQGRSYLQSKWFIRLLDSDRVTAQMNFNLHFTEGELLFQQTLSVALSIDNFSKPGKKRMHYPWMRIFQ
ncbi:MAG: hypothetical protein JJE08_03365 [Proteiniphilum sp.]|nr:hypothetical protein [Proteiniphilum sp.]